MNCRIGAISPEFYMLLPASYYIYVWIFAGQTHHHISGSIPLLCLNIGIQHKYLFIS